MFLTMFICSWGRMAKKELRGCEAYYFFLHFLKVLARSLILNGLTCLEMTLRYKVVQISFTSLCQPPFKR